MRDLDSKLAVWFEPPWAPNAQTIVYDIFSYLIYIGDKPSISDVKPLSHVWT